METSDLRVWLSLVNFKNIEYQLFWFYSFKKLINQKYVFWILFYIFNWWKTRICFYLTLFVITLLRWTCKIFWRFVLYITVMFGSTPWALLEASFARFGLLPTAPCTCMQIHVKANTPFYIRCSRKGVVPLNSLESNKGESRLKHYWVAISFFKKNIFF